MTTETSSAPTTARLVHRRERSGPALDARLTECGLPIVTGNVLTGERIVSVQTTIFLDLVTCPGCAS